MLSPQKFAEISGLSYEQVLNMCKNNDINAIKTAGGHFKIPEKELDKFKENDNYVSKEDYIKLLKENERLKTILEQFKSFVENLKVEG